MLIRFGPMPAERKETAFARNSPPWNRIRILRKNYRGLKLPRTLASFHPPRKKEQHHAQHARQPNPTRPEYVVQRLRGPRTHADTVSHSHPQPSTPLPRFRFVTGFNAFNAFLFSGKPKTTRPDPDALPSHPGFSCASRSNPTFLSLIPHFRHSFTGSWLYRSVQLEVLLKSSVELPPRVG